MNKVQIQKFREFRSFFKRFLKKNYGEKCSDYCFDCVVCRSWRIYEDFDSWVDDKVALEIYKKSGQEKII